MLFEQNACVIINDGLYGILQKKFLNVISTCTYYLVTVTNWYRCWVITSFQFYKTHVANRYHFVRSFGTPLGYREWAAYQLIYPAPNRNALLQKIRNIYNSSELPFYFSALSFMIDNHCPANESMHERPQVYMCVRLCVTRLLSV